MVKPSQEKTLICFYSHMSQGFLEIIFVVFALFLNGGCHVNVPIPTPRHENICALDPSRLMLELTSEALMLQRTSSVPLL